MSNRIYAKILSELELDYAPKTYRGISNYNKCEEFMLQDGFLPVVEEKPNTNDVSFKYKVSKDKISIEIETFDGKKKTIKTKYIYKEYIKRDLEYYKAEKRQKICEIKLEKLDIGAEIKFKNQLYHIQLDADGKANILGIKIKLDDLINIPNYHINFKTYENIVIELTPTEFSRLADASFYYSEYVVLEKEKLLKEIDNCATKEDLDLVIWTDPEAPDITDN